MSQFCHFHPKRLAGSVCKNCGISICHDCEHVVRGEILCRNCAAPKREEIPGRKARMRNPVLAGLLGIFPGLGQLYNGESWKALVVFLTSWLIIPWFYGIYDAYITACRLNEGRNEFDGHTGLAAGCLAFIILVFILLLGGGTAFRSFVYDYLLLPQGKTQEQHAQKILQEIAAGIDEYKKRHGGYPQDISKLYFSTPPYLEKLYCGNYEKGYGFVCDLSFDGYELRAIPQKENLNGFFVRNGTEVTSFKP